MPDRFGADDRLPFVRPEPKPLKVAFAGQMPDEHLRFWNKLLENVLRLEDGTLAGSVLPCRNNGSAYLTRTNCVSRFS